MANVTRSIEAAREEIRGVLRRYRLRWEDVVGNVDMDEAIWMRLQPTAKQVRKNIFRTSYPTLYARLRQRKKGQGFH